MARVGRGILCLTLVFCAIGTFGVLDHDETVFLSFADAGNRWQVNPEFRTAAMEYCIKGSAATRARFMGISAGRVVMFIRSLPGIPQRYAVNPTSQKHYDDFSRGPLSGYLHLCDEQKVPAMVALVESEGRKVVESQGTNIDLSPAAMGQLLSTFRMDAPVVNDDGARQSTAAVFRDTEVFGNNGICRPFKVRDSIVPLLDGPIRDIAAELHVPGDPNDMTPLQQQWVLDRLDSYVHAHDPELWRTKQLSDYFGGIWAQVYGPDYNMLIIPIMNIHKWSPLILVMLLGLLGIITARRLRSKENKIDAPNPLEPAGLPA